MGKAQFEIIQFKVIQFRVQFQVQLFLNDLSHKLEIQFCILRSTKKIKNSHEEKRFLKIHSFKTDMV